MSALRRALHQAVDLVLDAIEEDRAAGLEVRSYSNRPRKTRERAPIPARDVSQVPADIREKALLHARRNGIL